VAILDVSSTVRRRVPIVRTETDDEAQAFSRFVCDSVTEYAIFTIAPDGAIALARARERMPDLAILDVMMPGIDGLEVTRRLRAEGDLPILMLTARDAVEDRVRGLDCGADDYLVKPFVESELIARLNAILRRSDRPLQTVVRYGELAVDVSARAATYAGRPLSLGTTEFRMLELFARNAGQTFSRQQLLERIWDYDFDGTSNIVDVYISQLRRKLKQAGATDVIQTIWGIGYKFRKPEERLTERGA